MDQLRGLLVKPNKLPEEITGNFIIISSNVEDGEDVSLSDKQIEKYKKIFNDKSIEDTNIKITNIILQNNGFEI